jgi:hypothetical protein
VIADALINTANYRKMEDLVGVERDRASRPIEEIVVIAAFDFRKVAPILPKQIAGAAVQGVDNVLWVSKKNDTAMHQQRLFLISRLHVPGPNRPQSAHIAGPDLVVRAVTPGSVSGELALQEISRKKPVLKNVCPKRSRTPSLRSPSSSRPSAKSAWPTN